MCQEPARLILRWTAILAAVIATLVAAGTIAITAQSQPVPRARPAGSPPLQQTSPNDKSSAGDQRGTPDSPVVVKVLPTLKTQKETADEEAQREDQLASNWWTRVLAGLTVLIGLGQLVVYGIQARRLRDTIRKMDEIAKGQTADMQSSINEASRAAVAMERVAVSMAESVENVRDSVNITREIADRQKLVTELSNRAYLSIVFDGAVYQDERLRFEVSSYIVNKGSTPAYDVTFRAAAAVIPYPIPDEFDFPFSADNVGTSVSIIAPGLNKILRRVVAERVPDDQVASIKVGEPPQCLAMWGLVNYLDAFREPRFTKFAFVVRWFDMIGTDKDGNPRPPQVMCYDTTRHNEAN